MNSDERQLKEQLPEKLCGLKYKYRPDIRVALEANFCQKFEALIHVKLPDGEFLLLINDVSAAQIEVKTLDVVPRRASEQIVKYKKDAGIATVEPMDILKVDPLRIFGTPIEILKILGGEDSYLATVTQFKAAINQPHF